MIKKPEMIKRPETTRRPEPIKKTVPIKKPEQIKKNEPINKPKSYPYPPHKNTVCFKAPPKQATEENFPKNNCFGLSMEEYNLIMCGGRKKTVVVKNTNSFANRLKMFEPK